MRTTVEVAWSADSNVYLWNLPSAFNPPLSLAVLPPRRAQYRLVQQHVAVIGIDDPEHCRPWLRGSIHEAQPVQSVHHLEFEVPGRRTARRSRLRRLRAPGPPAPRERRRRPPPSSGWRRRRVLGTGTYIIRDHRRPRVHREGGPGQVAGVKKREENPWVHRSLSRAAALIVADAVFAATSLVPPPLHAEETVLTLLRGPGRAPRDRRADDRLRGRWTASMRPAPRRCRR
jgi:hypothetical protein